MLVGGLEHFSFFNILGISSSQLTLIFFRGVGIPPTIIPGYLEGILAMFRQSFIPAIHHCGKSRWSCFDLVGSEIAERFQAKIAVGKQLQAS